MTICIYRVTVLLIDREYRELPSRRFVVLGSSRDDARERVRNHLLDNCAILADASIAGLQVDDGATEDIVEVTHG